MTRILIVDDSTFALHRLKMIYESGGHNVVGCAANGEQALQMFKQFHPELVTLDQVMAGQSGEEVLEEILQLDPDARVIMISGAGDVTLEERVLQAGAKKFMRKYAEQKDFLCVIDQVMRA